jgi:hypothetical protein
MAAHRGKTFTTSRVRMDNEEFHNCRFERCVMVYAGAGGVVMDHCSFNDCRFEFEGAAGNTVKMMSALYQLSSDLIERTFDNIRLGMV